MRKITLAKARKERSEKYLTHFPDRLDLTQTSTSLFLLQTTEIDLPHKLEVRHVRRAAVVESDCRYPCIVNKPTEQSSGSKRPVPREGRFHLRPTDPHRAGIETARDDMPDIEILLDGEAIHCRMNV